MLKRLYIDNYKCFVNFEYSPGNRELLLGDNGSGKSSIFEVLAGLRALIIDGVDVADVFPRSTRTRWQERDQQSVELDVEGAGCIYHFILNLRYDQKTRRTIIYHEELQIDQTALYSSQDGEARLNNGHDASRLFLLVSNTRSGLFFLAQMESKTELKWFINWLRSLLVIRIDPYRMKSESIEEIDHPSVSLDNYASWYRHLVQENATAISNTTHMLQDIISGFVSLSLQKEGEQTRVLNVLISSDNRKEKYSIDELSEGQRALIALYTLVGILGDKPTLLCIDEPDNYVSLKEIQPWLLKIEELTECAQAQVLIISHHPEIINFLAPSAATRFYRKQNGPVRVEAFEVSKSNEGLLPSEIVARGWESD